jgi:hypothetical protein
MKREAIDMLEKRKLAMITGFWANDGMNDDKGTRNKALEELEEQFAQAVDLVQSGRSQQEEQGFTEEDEANPFLAPAIKATREIETPRDDEGSVKQAIESDQGSDFSVDQD